MPLMDDKKLLNPGGLEKLQENFRQYLIEQEEYLKPFVDGTAEEKLRTMSWSAKGLLELYIDSVRNNKASNDTGKGILYRKAKNTCNQDRYLILQPVRDRFENPDTDTLWRYLAILRMMQLNLAGDRDWEKVWVKSLMYDAKRLFDLVFQSKDRTSGWETQTLRLKREAPCAACYSSGREPAEFQEQDQVTVIPCSGGHMIHHEDVATWFVGKQKHCPECDEVVL